MWYCSRADLMLTLIYLSPKNKCPTFFGQKSVTGQISLGSNLVKNRRWDKFFLVNIFKCTAKKKQLQTNVPGFSYWHMLAPYWPTGFLGRICLKSAMGKFFYSNLVKNLRWDKFFMGAFIFWVEVCIFSRTSLRVLRFGVQFAV